ncbi:MAG: ATP-dependent DNA helicase [Planctomycetes bacterium]|nr:ATP-dependent DNA helicase [Planctomycetota bacterium]
MTDPEPLPPDPLPPESGGQEALAVAALLGRHGPIARRLPDFEVRPQQLALAQAIERALETRHHLLAEAGTGTGKSFAYLLPAAVYADRHQGEGPVVVSTRTIALQEQLEQKDLPFLHAVLPFEWSSVTAIGRNNYVCLRRLHAAQRDAGLFADPDQQAQLAQLAKWSLHTKDGTRQDLPFQVQPEVWEEVQAEHGNCLQRACPHFDHCHWQRARRRMQSAQVLVVNHALYCADLALRMAGAAYLPPHRVVVFDEAHHLERVATESLGLRLGPRTIGWHLRRLHHRRSEKSLLARQCGPVARLLWEEAHQHADAFFAELDHRLQQGGRGEGLALHDQQLEESVSPSLRALAREVAECAARTTEVDVRMELAARANGLEALCATLRALCVPNPEAPVAMVRWLEPSRHGALLCGAPLDVSQALRQHLFSNGPTCILTSATLGTSDDAEFTWLKQKLGIDRAKALRQGSPFDYDRSVRLVLEEGLPDPSAAASAFLREAGERTLAHVLENGGRALVLCTSWDFVRNLAAQLRPPLSERGIELLVQGEAPLARLLERKRSEPTSVLLGTDSLWEGIDVRGDALTLLVLTKLPFQSPGHPLVQARLAALRAQGRDPFAEHSLPEAILKFRQGFGRLIRSQQDRGTVVILDPRVRTKGYGRRFLASLPFTGSPEGGGADPFGP